MVFSLNLKASSIDVEMEPKESLKDQIKALINNGLIPSPFSEQSKLKIAKLASETQYWDRGFPKENWDALDNHNLAVTYYFLGLNKNPNFIGGNAKLFDILPKE